MRSEIKAESQTGAQPEEAVGNKIHLVVWRDESGYSRVEGPDEGMQLVQEWIDLKSEIEWSFRQHAQRLEQEEAIDEARSLFEKISADTAIRVERDESSGELHPRIRLADMIIAGLLTKDEFNQLEKEVLGVEFGSAGFNHDDLPF